MCAHDLLTLGQNYEYKFQNIQVVDKNKPHILYVPSQVSKPVVHRPGINTALNLDGNYSESSDSGAESDSENFSVCMNRDLTEKDRVKHISGSKSTVEGSCPSAVSKPYILKRHLKWKKVKRNVKSIKTSDAKLMEGEYPPYRNTSVKCSETGFLKVTSKTISESNSIASEGIINPVYGTSQSKVNVCDNLNRGGGIRTMNVNPNLTTMAMSVSSSTALSNVIAFSSNTTPVCVSSLTSSGGQIVAVSGMNLTHPPVLVLSGGGAYPTQLSAGNTQGNLIVGNFPGSMPMALIAGGAGNKPQIQGAQVSIHSSMQVPVGVTLSQPRMGLVSTQSFNTASISSGIQPSFTNNAPDNPPILIPEERPKESSRIEPTIQEDGTFLWPCNVCAKICPSESDLKIHKKRHKIDEALICPYCQRSYVDQHRYAVHVRIHTGETPFHCDLCGKGFRDDRKMKLHMARHNSGLSHKCHLCPRSFEGPKALEKHLNAHATGRYVAPKVIQKSDGTTAMALPEDKTKEDLLNPVVVAEKPPEMERMNAPSPIVLTPPDITRLPEGLSFDLKSEGSREDDSVSACSSMISLTMEDIYQYNVTQPEIRR